LNPKKQKTDGRHVVVIVILHTLWFINEGMEEV